jgi:hypothetical protein
MRLLFLAALFLPMTAMADDSSFNHFEMDSTSERAPAATTTKAVPTPAAAATNTTTVGAVSVPPAPESPKSPWRISYLVEYGGPQLGNIDFAKTQVPGAPADYTSLDNSLKIGYAVAKSVTLGTQIRGSYSFAPDAGFGFSDLRFYSQWSNMIDTSDVGMSGKLALELPTTSKNRNAGKLFAFKFDFNFDLKTQLRNWAFSFDFEIKPYFYNDPVSGGGKTDLDVGIFPYVTLDLSPNVQLLFEGSFDANHNYSASTYDFTSASNDYIDIGPLFTITPQINTNIALRFFMDDISFKQAGLYANLVVAL